MEKLEMKKCVSQEFYDFSLNHYPSLIDNKAYRRFFLYIAFSCWTDEKGLLLIPYELIAKCCGLDPISYDHKKWSSGKFLKDFQQYVLPNIQWKEYETSEDYGD